ncbi:DUF6610 family protein [Phyllobacterium sp. 22229]|uniref:DUF6610 family protein n=1 Tax=Phyllobacterium sp. 22229 TaxID=3453895 RepID=UPI003F85DD74
MFRETEISNPDSIIGHSTPSSTLRKFVAHSYHVASIATEFGWLPGARYTNLRDIRRFDRLGFLDINWRNYNFSKHLEAAKETRPLLTVARDIENIDHLSQTLDEAYQLLKYADTVVVVPKDVRLTDRIEDLIPREFALGFSVPTRYGGTAIPTSSFLRPVHLLGGRPDIQRRLAREMPIASLDCNRFTLDAGFGDYFDGERFRPHPLGGYETCLRASLLKINGLWADYIYDHPKGYVQ